MAGRSLRMANIPASMQIARRSAPFLPSVCFATSVRSTLSSIVRARQWTFKIDSRPASSGRGISMIRSNRPGRSNALSRISILFVAPMIFTSPRLSNPSMPARSCMRVRCTSRSPDVFASVREAPTASISSMKIMVGAFFRARSNNSRTRRAPSPIYFWTSSDPTTRMKCAFVS